MVICPLLFVLIFLSKWIDLKARPMIFASGSIQAWHSTPKMYVKMSKF